MCVRRCYHRATGSIREAWQSSADTRTLLAYDKSCSFDQRPSGFADDLVSTNLTKQGSGYLWARTLEIGSQDAYVGIGFRMTLQLVKPRLHELRRIRVVANYQFGRGASKAFPKTILITRSPNTHRIRHIYNNSELLATYRPKDGLLALSIPGGRALRDIFNTPRLRGGAVS